MAAQNPTNQFGRVAITSVSTLVLAAGVVIAAAMVYTALTGATEPLATILSLLPESGSAVSPECMGTVTCDTPDPEVVEALMNE